MTNKKDRWPARLASLGVGAGALLLGAWLQGQVLLSSDVGWLIRSVRLMAEGQRFGSELFELNLPIVWYLCLPAAWLVTNFDLGEVEAIRAWIWVLIAASLLVTRVCVLASSRRNGAAWLEYAAMAIAGSVLAASSFGQREHLALVLSLPYMVLAHDRSSGATVRRGPAIAGGIVSGIAFAIKPLFVIVPIFIELVMLATLRREWKLFRPESIAMVLAGLACVLVVLVFAPEYLTQVVPMVYATYWAYDLPMDRVLPGFAVALPVLLGWLAALTVDPRLLRGYAVWLAGFLAWTATYFIQSRAFDYHGFPALASAFVLSVGFSARMFSRVVDPPGTPPAPRWGIRRWHAAFALAMVVFTTWPLVDDVRTWYRAAIEEDWPLTRAQTRREVIERVRALGIGPGDSVLAFSTHPFPAFPTLNYLGADWVGPDMAHFPLPAWIRRDEVQDPDRLSAVEAAMATQRQHVRQALLQAKPDYLFVDIGLGRAGSPHAAGLSRIDYFRIYGSDPEVATALARYRTVAEVRQIRILVRDDGPAHAVPY
ncbi:MAG: hypothetical protein ACT4UP_08060 [Gammaproteobacteria bacterium]